MAVAAPSAPVRLGRLCAHPDCNNRFVVGERNPEQEFCSESCRGRYRTLEKNGGKMRENPHKQIACAILAQAVHDWKRYGKVKAIIPPKSKGDDYYRMNTIARTFRSYRRELLEFFWSEAFELYCDMAEVNPDVCRERLGLPALEAAA